MNAPLEHEPARRLMADLVRSLGQPAAHKAVDIALKSLSNVELAALANWWEFWARPKQLPPPGPWRSWGFLGARRSGKTIAISKYINREVYEGRAHLIGLAAQDEENSIAIQVTGPSGLIATAHPKFRPHWESGSKQLVWPNGARAYVRTPEVPGKIRGLEYALFWGTEIQSWPRATRDEAHMNAVIATSVGYARFLWDATPKRRHPILKERLALSEAEPGKHVIVRVSMRENAAHLGAGYIEDLERTIGGTRQGEEEIEGRMFDDSESALVEQAWINGAKRDLPSVIVRKALAVDPAITTRAGSDRTGIILAGLGTDSQLLVLGDYSGKHTPPAWAKIVLDVYLREGCDLVVVETNRGGDLLVQVLRAAAAVRNLQVVVVDDAWRPERRSGVVFVRERHSRGPKEDRAQPLATAYERGRVSHIRGVDLSELEEILTTWEPVPGAKSPDGLDALVHVAGELLDLAAPQVDGRVGFRGIESVARALRQTPVRSPLVGRGYDGGRI